MLRIYLAGPISGLSYEECVVWRDQLKAKIYDQGLQSMAIQCLSPMRQKDYLKKETSIKDAYEDTVLSSSKGIFTRDFNDVLRSDLVVVNFLNAAKVSIGTVMEIAWARAFNKPLVVIMEKGNIHDHSFVRECAGFVVDTLDEAARTICHVLLP